MKALAKPPDQTVIDGEVVALDENGRPSFNLLQNDGSATTPVVYFVFDVMVLAGRNVMTEPLSVRRELSKSSDAKAERAPIRHTAPLDASLPVLIESVKAHGLEGLVPSAATVDMNRASGLAPG